MNDQSGAGGASMAATGVRAFVVAVICAIAGGVTAATVSNIVASRGTASVSLDEVDARLEEVPSDMRAVFMDNPARLEQTVSQLLLVEQIANEAVAAGLDKDPSFAGQVELAKKRILTMMQLNRVRAQALKEVDIAALAKERYLADNDTFYQPENRTARHILFGTDVNSDADARAKADAALQRAKKGEDFEKLAKELSEDTGTREQGGLMANVTRGRTDPAFENALYGLEQPNQLSDVVKTQFGYHVIQLVSIQPRAKRDYESVRVQIENEVATSASDRAARAYSDQLQNLEMSADPELVKSLRTRYGEVTAIPGRSAEAAQSVPPGQGGAR